MARFSSSSLPSDIRAPRLFESRWLALQRSWYRPAILVYGDIIAMALAWKGARFLNQFYSPIPPELDWWVWLGMPSLFWILAIATLILFTHYGLYSKSIRARDYLKAGQLISFVYLLSLVLGYFYDPKMDPPRSLFITAWFSSMILVIGARLLVNLGFGKLLSTQQPNTVFLIARAGRLRHLSQIIERRSHCQIVGAAIASTANSPTTFQSVLKTKADVVLAEDVPDVELASGLYWRLRGAGIPLRLLPSSREMLYRRGLPEIFAGMPTLHIENSIFQTIDYRFKRWMDYIASVLGLIVLAPLLMVIAIAIRCSSPGPAFFRQERMGLHGKIFRVWKFRTMTVNASGQQASLEQNNESIDGILFKMRQDPRITGVGKFLRQTSLDELPQLFNILLGQMSLVGPRPLPLRDIAHFEPWHHIRHQVLPGMTGLWQISGRSDIENFDDIARLDLHYIDNWSLNLDVEILLETIKIVLGRHGAY
jgi:exopolysaccharide biosynthesis polyprenyl glycosylphosphotransferase